LDFENMNSSSPASNAAAILAIANHAAASDAASNNDGTKDTNDDDDDQFFRNVDCHFRNIDNSEMLQVNSRPVWEGVSKGEEDVWGVVCPQGVEGSGMAGPGETLGSPWIPLPKYRQF
jgi:hypothetical protein